MHVPAFAPNLAYGDIVKVDFDEGEFHFDVLFEESGFSVAHIVLWNLESKDRIISCLSDLDCGVNTNVAENYLVISIPPQQLYKPVQTYLIAEKTNEVIDFRDCLSKIHLDNF